MADLHHHHYESEVPRTVVEDTEGPSAVLVAIIVLLLVGFLIWLFAFSGVVFERNNTGPTINNNNPTVQVPQDSGEGGGGETQPNPSP